MSSPVIFIVGVGFSSEDTSSHVQVSIQNVCQQLGEKQVTGFPNGSGIDEYRTNGGSLIKAFDPSRILFGLKVADESEGRKKKFAVEQFLKNYGIDLPVNIWSWDPITNPGHGPEMVA